MELSDPSLADNIYTTILRLVGEAQPNASSYAFY
jgi:hypothetical protein